VQAVTHYDDPEILAEVSRSLGEPMVGINISEVPQAERLAVRGW
ncbi:MAG: pyridoxal 5'-phosphate synthase lyase subunit PdxS, partial [Chloroflexota bacterium]